jgi:heme/copper-type cytochrome/quinol oxidase subunit 1
MAFEIIIAGVVIACLIGLPHWIRLMKQSRNPEAGVLWFVGAFTVAALSLMVTQGFRAFDAETPPTQETWSRLIQLGFIALACSAVFVLLILRSRRERAAKRESIADEKMPNKAPEPTPGAVTPRATEGESK